MMVSQEEKNEVYLKHYDIMLKFLRTLHIYVRSNAHDVLHSFFVHWNRQNIKKIDGKELDSLLWTALRNYAKSYTTQEYRRYKRLEVSYEIESDIKSKVHNDSKELQMFIEDLYNNLSDKHKYMFNLLINHDWVIKEAAETEGINYKAFEARLRRCLFPELKEIAEVK